MLPQDITCQSYDRTLIEPEVQSEEKQTDELIGPENGFYKGIMVALPISIAIWIMFITGINSLYSYLV